MPTVSDLGRKVKAKYPGEYDDLSDQDVGARTKAKYPEYADFTDESGPAQNAFGGGLAKFAAPMIGGMAGAYPGAMTGAGLGTMVAPGPGTIIGGILGGMVGAGAGGGAAEAGRQKLAGEELNPQEIANTALWTGATEPLGLVLGPGIKGVRALGGAKGVAAAGKEFLQGVSRNVEAQIGRTTAEKLTLAGGSFQAATEAAEQAHKELMQGASTKMGELVETADAATRAAQSRAEAGLANLQARVATRAEQLIGDFGRKVESSRPGSMAHVVAGKTMRQVQKEFSESSARINELAKNAKAAVAHPQELIGPVMETVAQLKQVGSPAAATVERLARRWVKSVTWPPSAERVLAFKRMAQDMSRRLYERESAARLGGQLGQRATAKSGAVNFYEGLAKTTQQWLEQNVPGIAEENLNNRSLQGAREILAKAGPRLTKMSETAARTTEAALERAQARVAAIESALSKRLAKHEAEVGRKVAGNYEGLAGQHAAHAAESAAISAEGDAAAAASRAAIGASRRKGLARAATIGAAQAIPGSSLPIRAAELAGGFALGGLAEPVTTPLAMGLLNLLGNPVFQQILRQLPRAGAGLAREPGR